MKRREFITLLGGAATVWPLAARAQQGEKMRRIGVLMPFAADDPEAKARLAAFHQGLQQLGWTEGRNVRIDVRWGSGEPERIRRYATELVALAPDVILASTTPAMGELHKRPAPYRSNLCRWSILSLPASSIGWRDQVATSPVLRRSNTASAGNGWSS
jgi:ABC-type uncharacterized transport system substrate-binding protein